MANVVEMFGLRIRVTEQEMDAVRNGGEIVDHPSPEQQAWEEEHGFMCTAAYFASMTDEQRKDPWAGA